MDTKNLVDALLEAFRQIIREEIGAAMNGNRPAVSKEWMTAGELSELYSLPATWFERLGRQGDLKRTKPGRRVLFLRRDVELFLEKNKRSR